MASRKAFPGWHPPKGHKKPKIEDPKQFLSTTEPNDQGLGYFKVEISWGTRWIDLNDHNRYIIQSEGVGVGPSKTYRKITSQSNFLEGQYLVHAIADQMTENLKIWVHGNTQADLSDNIKQLDTLFEQWHYRMRWTFDNYREYWDCQLADISIDRSSAWTHNTMAAVTLAIPRFPSVSREEIL